MPKAGDPLKTAPPKPKKHWKAGSIGAPSLSVLSQVRKPSWSAPGSSSSCSDQIREP